MLSSFIQEYTDALSQNTYTFFPLLFLLYVCTAVIYRLYFSPLSRIPGPRLAAITKLYILYHDFKQCKTRKVTNLHQRYGPVVRIATNEISYTSADAIKKIYTGSGKEPGFPKTKLYGLLFHFGEHNMVSSMANIDHTWRRKANAAGWTQTYILKKEASDGHVWMNVGKCLDFVEREGLSDGNTPGRSVDLAKICAFYAIDVASVHIFGQTLGTHCLDSPNEHNDVEKHRQIIADMQDPRNERGSNIYLETDLKLPLILFEMVEGLYNSCARLFNGKQRPEAFFGFESTKIYAFNAYHQAKEQLKDGIGNDIELQSQKLIQFVSNNGKISNSGKESTYNKSINDNWAVSELVDQILAGVVCRLGPFLKQRLTFLGYHSGCLVFPLLFTLTSREPALSRATSTIASILEDVWINAIVKETLLIYPAVPVELPRVVPAGGTTIDGIWLPEGTLTSGFIESVNYSLIDKTGSNIQWTPERWLMKEGANGADKLHEEARIQELERRMWGFGSGARGCIGKHFSILEIKLLVAGILSRYQLVKDDTDLLRINHTQWTQRKLFRDVMYFYGVKGVVKFVPLPK